MKHMMIGGRSSRRDETALTAASYWSVLTRRCRSIPLKCNTITQLHHKLCPQGLFRSSIIISKNRYWPECACTFMPSTVWGRMEHARTVGCWGKHLPPILSKARSYTSGVDIQQKIRPNFNFGISFSTIIKRWDYSTISAVVRDLRHYVLGRAMLLLLRLYVAHSPVSRSLHIFLRFTLASLRLMLFSAEWTSVCELCLAAGRLAEHCRASDAKNDGLGVREYRGYLVATWTLHVHEKGIWRLYQTLEFATAPLLQRAGI